MKVMIYKLPLQDLTHPDMWEQTNQSTLTSVFQEMIPIIMPLKWMMSMEQTYHSIQEQ